MNLDYFKPLEKCHFFSAPKRIMFGTGVAKNVGGELESFQQKKLLVITDNKIAETDSVKSLINSLSACDYKTKIFLSETKEPTAEMITEFIKFCRAEKEGIVIGIGGGSIMDQAKVASFMTLCEGEVDDYLGTNKAIKSRLPLVLIPTTAGTGAETSPNAVIKKQTKKYTISSTTILPDLAVVDPLLTLSLPKKPTAFTGIDALSHAVEAIISLNSNPLTIATSLEAISLIDKNLPLAFFSGYNIEARYNMSLAATLGGLSLNSGATLAHSISYTLEKFGVPHGLGCAIGLPQVIRFNVPVMKEKIKRIAVALGFDELNYSSYAEIASYVVNRVNDLNAMLDIPLTLKSMSITIEKSKELAQECFQKYPRPNNPRLYSEDDIIKLYADLWEGKLEIENI
jgi:alcohol dehydrogenase class IV